MQRMLLAIAATSLSCAVTPPDTGPTSDSACSPEYISIDFEVPGRPVEHWCRPAIIHLHYYYFGASEPCTVSWEDAWAGSALPPEISIGARGEVFARPGPVTLNVLIASFQEEFSGLQGMEARYYSQSCRFDVVRAGPRDTVIEARLAAPCELVNNAPMPVTRERIVLRAVTIRARRAWGSEKMPCTDCDAGMTAYCR
jgi:hypothetical protein